MDECRVNMYSIFDWLINDPRIEIAPLTIDVLTTSLALPIAEMHDRLIVATAIYLGTFGHDAVLVTGDAKITSSGLVRTVW